MAGHRQQRLRNLQIGPAGAGQIVCQTQLFISERKSSLTQKPTFQRFLGKEVFNSILSSSTEIRLARTLAVPASGGFLRKECSLEQGQSGRNAQDRCLLTGPNTHRQRPSTLHANDFQTMDAVQWLIWVLILNGMCMLGHCMGVTSHRHSNLKENDLSAPGGQGSVRDNH